MAHGHDNEDFSSHTARGADADPPPRVTAFAGVVGVLVIVASIGGLEALFHYTSKSRSDAMALTDRFETRRAQQDAQRDLLSKYAYDKEKKSVQIPIDRAMELVLSDLKPAPPGGGN